MWNSLSVIFGDVLYYKQFTRTDGTGATTQAFDTKLKYKSPSIWDWHFINCYKLYC